jgi:hypothetical protein
LVKALTSRTGLLPENLETFRQDPEQAAQAILTSLACKDAQTGCTWKKMLAIAEEDELKSQAAKLMTNMGDGISLLEGRADTLAEALIADPNHDARMRIGGELRGGGPILDDGTKAMAWHGTPPPRTVIAPLHHAREIGKERCFGCRV